MANKTIPQLPLQTGITDNDLLAIVDSGETTTSRIKVSTLLSSAGGGAFQTGDATDSIVPAYSPTSRGVAANTTYVDKLNVNLANAIDIDNGVNNSYNIIGGYGTRGTVTGALGSTYAGGRNPQLAGNANFVAGQFGSSINGENNGMVAGRGNVIGGGEYNFMGGGRSINITAFYSGALGGNGNSVTGNYSTILGGSSNTQSGQWSSMIATDSSNCTGQRTMVASCHNSDILGAPRFSTIMGGWNHTISTAADDDSLMILGGNGNTINNVGGSSNYSTILQGSNQTISNSTDSIIVGGSNNTLAGGTNVIMLGCSGRTSTSDYTTYVETLEAFDGIVLNDYANLNFASDSAAATGGVPLGGMYHNSGDMKIRIT